MSLMWTLPHAPTLVGEPRVDDLDRHHFGIRFRRAHMDSAAAAQIDRFRSVAALVTRWLSIVSTMPVRFAEPHTGRSMGFERLPA